MSSMDFIMDVARSGMIAERMRMNTSASNMSNANVVTGNADEVYKAQYPIFSTIQENAMQGMKANPAAGVEVKGVYENDAPAVARYEPHNPLADKDGFVYAPNVNYIEEMANLISASRSYQINLEMIHSAKQMILRTINTLRE